MFLCRETNRVRCNSVKLKPVALCLWMVCQITVCRFDCLHSLLPDGNVSSQCVTVESTGGSSRALSEEGMRRLGRYVSVTFEDEEDVVDTNGGNTDEGQLVKRKRKRGKKKKKKNTGTARSIVTVEYEDDDKEEERETEEMLEESLPVKKSKSKRKKNDDPVSKIKLKETECVAKKAKKCKRRVQSSSSSLSV